MTNCVLITNGSRPRLLEQTLRTLIQNTSAGFKLTVVDDGCNPSVSLILEPFDSPLYRISTVRVRPACHIIGRLKNLGAYWSEKHFGRGDWLCFLDDDMAFFPGWLPQTKRVLGLCNQVRILGGIRHPFHGVNDCIGIANRDGHDTVFVPSVGNVIPTDAVTGVEVTDAVAGYCHFMRWSTWDKFGPYDAHAKGTGQSEDFALCRKIVDAGGKVGYIHPPVMAHCGLTNSEGNAILGGELIERIPGILYE